MEKDKGSRFKVHKIKRKMLEDSQYHFKIREDKWLLKVLKMSVHKYHRQCILILYNKHKWEFKIKCNRKGEYNKYKQFLNKFNKCQYNKVYHT